MSRRYVRGSAIQANSLSQYLTPPVPGVEAAGARGGRLGRAVIELEEMAPALIGLELAEIEELLGPNEPAYRARQLLRALYRERTKSVSEITTLPAALRRELERQTVPGWPELETRYESVDATRRYLLRLEDGKTVEAVLMPEERRDTICISTQVGCAAGCSFCLTGRMGLERNLTAGEIVGQVLFVAEDNGLRPGDGRLNVVMMGQGEPLLNLPSVLKATRLLVARDGFGLSEKRITLSTAGIIPRIDELGRARRRPKLAISLNASSQRQRAELMPLARSYPLEELLAACRRYPLRAWEKLTFEYVLLKGVNDSDADARRLVRLLAQLNCKVNLIPLNPGPAIEFETPGEARVLAFQRILRRAFPCFIRRPRGRDIFAACGQLQRLAVAGGTANPLIPQ